MSEFENLKNMSYDEFKNLSNEETERRYKKIEQEVEDRLKRWLTTKDLSDDQMETLTGIGSLLFMEVFGYIEVSDADKAFEHLATLLRFTLAAAFNYGQSEAISSPGPHEDLVQ